MLIFVLVNIFVLFSNTHTADAVPVPVPLPTIDLVQTKMSIWEKAWHYAQVAYTKSKEVIKVASDVAVKNGLRVFFGQLAEDTAVWLASAGTGQKPLFITDPNYWKNLTDAAAGDALYSLGANTFGINVCEPDLNAKLSITFALNKTFNPATWCTDNCRASFNSEINTSNVLYSGEVQYSTTQIIRDDNASYPQAGLITYFQQYATESRFEIFASLHPDGDFLCPVSCGEIMGPVLPGYICVDASHTSSIDQAITLDLELENLQGCISTLQNISIKEKQSAETQRRLCLVNCDKGATKSKCMLPNILKNIKHLKNQKLVPTFANAYLQIEQNDIGQLLFLYGLIDEKTQAELAKERLLYESPHVGPVTAKVSKEILSPKEAVLARLNLAVDKSTVAEEVYTGSPRADIVTIFTNTLVNKLIERFYGGRCALNPGASGCSGPTGGSKLSQIVFGAGGPSGIAAAKLQFASISKVNFTRGSPGQDPIDSSDLASQGIIGSGLQTAIDQQMTVGEAINKGLIGGTFGFDAEGREPIIDSGIPYRAIVYLRNYRVVPVGWELAAKWIRDHPQNVSLEQLASQEFYDCDSGGNSVCSDDSSISCRGNSDCYDYPLCPDDSCVDDSQICVVEADGGPAACYDDCITDDDCGENASCIDTPGAFPDHCVGDDQPYCRYEVSASPFCGLVDPNWVLKMPDTYCEKRGASEEIISKEYLCLEDTNDDDLYDCSEEGGDIGEWQVIRNTETCVDEISCLIEDSTGKCLKYGYCFEERPSWKFNGDECSRQYVSCQSLERSDGQQFSYLMNTVDNNGCDVTNAGCRWYCREPSYDEATRAWTCTRDLGDKIHFDRDVEECLESEVGCQEFIRYDEEVNMVQNGSFEYYFNWVDGQKVDGEADDSVDDQWEQVWLGNGTAPYSCGAIGEATTDAYAGSVAAKLSMITESGDVIQICSDDDTGRTLTFSQIDTGHSILNRTFTVSFYAKASNACTLRAGSSNGLGGSGFVWEYYGRTTFNLTNDWRRYSYNYTVDRISLDDSGDPVSPNALSLGFRPNPDCEIYIDAVQLEEGGLTAYKDYGTTNLTYLNQTRVSCPADDVGCDKYTPVKGGVSIPGVVYGQNLCSADKVGCNAFQEMPTENIPQRDGVDPLYFISGTGTKCNSASVGCEEYTNLDEVAAGGEGKAYFKQIRQCVKPEAPDVATYYTWEGDDVQGYQLRAFELKESNLGDAPCTNLSVSVSGEEPVCEDDIREPATCLASEMGYNPDCTEYYDTNAVAYYLLRSRVIEATEGCKSYRNTIDSQSGDDNIYFLDSTKSLACSASEVGCREYKGNMGQVTRPIFEDNFENPQTAASNWMSGFLSNESLRANEHSLRVVGNSTGTSVSTPAVLDGKLIQGQEYHLTFWLKPETATTINRLVIQNNGVGGPEDALIFVSDSDPVTLTQDWNRYTFGPLRFTRSVGDFEQLAINTDGSFFLDNVLLEEVSDTTYLIKDTYIRCSANDLGCEEYKDSKGKTHYIKSFDHLCAEQYIGCEAMVNTQNSNYPFSETIKEIYINADTIETIVYDSAKLCPSMAKGCNKFGLPMLNILEEPSDWITRYLINDPDKYDYSDGEKDTSIACLSAHDRCDEYTYTNGEGVSWFKDPSNKTCEYKLGSIEYQWFKTATTNLCPTVTPPIEGKPTGKACVRACTAGIYRDQACVENRDCPGGECGGEDGSVGNSCLVDGDCPLNGYICDYWVGLCPFEQSGCNEYRDPSDPDNCRSTCSLEEIGGEYVPVDDSCNPTVCFGGDRNGEYCYSTAECPGEEGVYCTGIGIPGCRSYYYIRDTVEDNKAECGNTINFEEGCLPFNDISNPELNMRGL